MKESTFCIMGHQVLNNWNNNKLLRDPKSEELINLKNKKII